jgi:hypothetical protein
MPDYSKGVIYTIRSGECVYVGSTTNFTNRKYQHKYAICNENNEKYNRRLYQTIRDNGEWIMKPYKEFPCNSKLELEIEEEKVRRELNADLNMNACQGFDLNEYNRKRRDITKEYYKAYHNKNKEYRKEYYEQNKDEIKRKQREKYRERKRLEKTKNENE